MFAEVWLKKTLASVNETPRPNENMQQVEAYRRCFLAIVFMFQMEDERGHCVTRVNDYCVEIRDVPPWVTRIHDAIATSDAEHARELLQTHANNSKGPYVTLFVCAALDSLVPVEMLDLLEANGIDWTCATRFDRGARGDWMLQWAFDWMILYQSPLKRMDADVLVEDTERYRDSVSLYGRELVRKIA